MIGMEFAEIKTEYDVLKHGLLTSVAVTNVDLSDEQRAHYLQLLKRFENAAKQIDDKALSKLKGAVMQAIYASQAYLIVNNRTVKRNAKRECMRANKVLERTKAGENG